ARVVPGAIWRSSDRQGCVVHDLQRQFRRRFCGRSALELGQTDATNEDSQRSYGRTAVSERHRGQCRLHGCDTLTHLRRKMRPSPGTRKGSARGHVRIRKVSLIATAIAASVLLHAAPPPSDPVFPYGAVYFRKSNPPEEDWARDHKTAADIGMNTFRH